MADIIAANPRLKRPILKVLSIVGASVEADRAGVEGEAAEAWEGSYSQSPSTVVDILVRNGAIVERVLVNGEPYAGTLEDVQLDDNVPDDAVAVERLALTEKGVGLMERYAPASTLGALFASRPQYADVFQAVLWACDDERGCQRADLEAQLMAMPQLGRDPQTGRTSVYPQYFIDALETAGGIAWDGAWHTTAAGKAMIAA